MRFQPRKCNFGLSTFFLFYIIYHVLFLMSIYLKFAPNFVQLVYDLVPKFQKYGSENEHGTMKRQKDVGNNDFSVNFWNICTWRLVIHSAPSMFRHFFNNPLYSFNNASYSPITCMFLSIHVAIRCLMVSTDQADPSYFYFRISWILMKRRGFYFFRPLLLVQGLRSNNIK